MLVGREAERAACDQLSAGARVGESGALVVSGEAGIGKTALLEEAAAAAVGMRILRATGSGPEREMAFGGLHQLLRPTLDLLDQIPQPQAAALASALALREGEPGDRFAIGAATLSLLGRCAEERPLLVVLDDAHELDRPSLEALVFTARRLLSDRIAILAATRPDDEPAPLAVLPHLTVLGLELEPASRLIATRRRDPVAADLVRRLHDATAGNPLAMLELAGNEEVIRLPPEVPVPVPDALTGVFGRRIAQLGDAAQTALLLAAVADGDLAVVSRASPAMGTGPAELAAAEDAGLVAVSGGQVSFRHPMVRSSAYGGASAARRRRAHRAVAEVLSDRDADRRTWHLAEACWGPDRDVAERLARAGDRARARSGYAVASTAYERAAELSPGDDDRCVLLLKAAEAAWASGQPSRVDTLLAELDGLPASPDVVAGAVDLRAAVAARTGSLQEALRMLLTAADADVPPDRRVELLADAVHAAFYLGDTATASALADRLTELTRAAGSSRARALGSMASGIALVLAGRGGADEIRAAVPLLETSGELRADPRRWPWLMLAPLFLRDATGGMQLRALVRDIRAAAGVGTLPAVLFHVARDEATTDAWDRATGHYAEAVGLARETGQTTELIASLSGRCWHAARCGDEDSCLADAAEVLELCRERSMYVSQAWVHFALGDLALSLADPLAASARLRPLMGMLAGWGIGDPDLSPCPELVDALVRTGELDEARQLVPPYRAAADAKGQPWARARACRAVALVGPDDQVDAGFGGALELHALTLDVFETARTRLAYGERLRRAGRRVDSRPQLREALLAFDRLGAVVWAGRAATELAATGETVERVEAGWRTALTPQELQVALLLADGRTTREAAAALFLSPKTVEYHLRKAYTKLGIHSREELTTAVAELAGGAD